MKYIAKLLGATIVSVSISLLLLLLVNIGFHLNNISKLEKKKKDWGKGLNEYQQSSYSHLSSDQIAKIRFYSWDPSVAGWEYEPWLGFKEKARTSQYVNVTQEGIRKNSEQDFSYKQLQNSIWFFGGSTTFGYGVADNETIPANLERMIGTKVVNLGRGFYYSRQENFYMVNLLVAGFRPDKILFLDGINERCDIGVYQAQMERLFQKAQLLYSWDYMEAVKPILVGMKKIDVVFDRGEIHKAFSTDHCDFYGTKQSLSSVLNTILIERQAICDAFNIRCITYLQPFPGMHGNHFDSVSLKEELKSYFREKYNLLNPTFTARGAISLVKALDNLQGHAYVDDVHYNAKANEAIASEIFRTLQVAH